MLRREGSPPEEADTTRRAGANGRRAQPLSESLQRLLSLQGSAGNAAVVQLLTDRVQRTIVGEDGNRGLWGEVIAPAVGNAEAEISDAVHRLHSMRANVAVANYPALVERIRAGEFNAYLEASRRESPAEAKYEAVRAPATPAARPVPAGSRARSADEKVEEKGEEKVAPKVKDPESLWRECRTRGQKVWDQVLAAQKAIRARPKATTAGGIPDAKDGTADRFRQHYRTTMSKLPGKQGYKVMSNTTLREAAARKDPSSKEPIYINIFDIASQSITADRNWAFDPDTNKPLDLTPKDVRLQNSDILWHQYRAAVRQYELDQKLEAGQRNLKVKKVTRKNIVNEDTKSVVRLCYPEKRSFDKGHGMIWKPDHPFFHAVLGTPNASGVGYMLAQHMLEMEGRPRTISYIQAISNNNGTSLDLIIYLKRSK